MHVSPYIGAFILLSLTNEMCNTHDYARASSAQGTTTRCGHAAPYQRRGRVHLNTNAMRRLPAGGPS